MTLNDECPERGHEGDRQRNAERGDQKFEVPAAYQAAQAAAASATLSGL